MEDEALKWDFLFREFHHRTESGCFLWFLNISPLRMMVKDYPWDIWDILVYERKILKQVIGNKTMAPGSGS